jgi:hypothetical protein
VKRFSENKFEQVGMPPVVKKMLSAGASNPGRTKNAAPVAGAAFGIREMEEVA